MVQTAVALAVIQIVNDKSVDSCSPTQSVHCNLTPEPSGLLPYGNRTHRSKFAMNAFLMPLNRAQCNNPP